MGRQEKRVAARGSLADIGISRRLRRRFAATTILTVAPFLGYGREAHADCNIATAPDVVCNDTIAGFDFTFNNLNVSTDGNPQFVVQATGVVIDGAGHIQFHDENGSVIANTGGNGLDVRSTGDNPGTIPPTPGAVTIVTDATITGSANGIFARNYGAGSIEITADGEVTGEDGAGIYAANGTETGGGGSQNLTITTGMGSDVTGRDDGIEASNRGAGDLTITTFGAVTGRYGDGIDADNDDYEDTGFGRNLAITIGADSEVTGAESGVNASNDGMGYLAVTVRGTAIGEGSYGVRTFNSENGTDLRVVTDAGSVVTGDNAGIRAANNGSGNLSITANGTVTGDGVSSEGIYAVNRGIDLIIETGARSSVTGDQDGIDATNEGIGNLKITAYGTVTGRTSEGIFARNAAIGIDLNVTTGAGSAVTGSFFGIFASNDGSGDLAITVDGEVTATGEINPQFGDGIGTRNDTLGMDLTVTTGAESVVTGKGNLYGVGIRARNYGRGDLTIEALGEVTGKGSDGIFAYNAGAGSDTTGSSVNMKITTGAQSVVTGAGDGIDANNEGSGYSEIVANGRLRGYSGSGIEVDNEGTFLKVTTGLGSDVAGSVHGIEADNDGTGNLKIVANGRVAGESLDGIRAQNEGAALMVTTGAGAAVSGLNDGIDADHEGTGALTVTVKGSVTGTGLGSDPEDLTDMGDGIDAANAGSGITDIKIEAGGLVQGANAGINAHSTLERAVSITNGGTVRNLSGESDDLAITAVDGIATIDNNANLIGTVALSRFGDILNNAGVWNAADGASEFGANDGSLDVVNNSGTLIAADDGSAAEETFLNNLEIFNNAGLVTLVDGAEGDTLSMTWNFVGQGGRLAVDAFLAPGGASDQLLVGLDSTGVTYVKVNLTNPQGSTANPDGIPVVVVEEITTDGDFDVEGGVLYAGFFAWDMRLDTDGHTHELYTSGIGLGAYEFAAGIGGAQEMWQQTMGTIHQRQADLRVLLEGMGVTPVADYAEPVAPTPVAHVTPGFWFRGVGAYVEQDDEEQGFTLDRKQTIWGGMAGFDFGHESAGSAWLFGVFGGYLTSDLDFDETNSKWTYEGPSIGAYATYIDHGLYADVTVKADFLDIEIDPDDLAPLSDDADTDAVNIGGRFDAGYKFGETWFVEPQATLAVVHTEIDDVDIFGGEVEFDDETSVRGRLGLRLGIDHTASTATIYSADVTGSVWEDFSGDNDVTITDPTFGTFGVSDDAGRTYGDVSLGFSAADPEGWSGFIRGNYLFASDFEAITGNAGIRYAW